MPLSDREQQILQDIERRLYEQDPEFAHGVAATTLHTHLIVRIRRGVLLFLVGVAMLVTFFFLPKLPIGVVAFLGMLAGATYTYHNLRRMGREQLKALREQNLLSNIVGRLGERFRGPNESDQA